MCRDRSQNGFRAHVLVHAFRAISACAILLSFGRFCTAEVKISGVPDYQQNDFAGTNDCTPVASADILGYWDANGFPNMIDGSNSFATNPAGVTALVDTLKTNMWWSSAGTSLDMIKPGMSATIKGRGYTTFSVNNDYAVVWDDIKAEVNNGLPALFTMYNPFYGALHSVASLGYDEPDGTRIVIVHDNWYPANDMELNFDECTGALLTKVQPPITAYTLTVQSSPVTSVAVTVSPADRSGQSNGNTNFTRSYNSGTSVTLTAHATKASGEVDYAFVRWTRDGANQPDGQTSLQVTMNAAHTAVAVYQIVQRTLTVESTPDAGVEITGGQPGITNYAATCDDEEIVSLTAPAQATFVSEDYVFVRWVVDGADQAEGEGTLTLTMSADRTARAVYQLAPPSAILDLAAVLEEGPAPELAVAGGSGSSVLYGTYVAANAFDGNLTTFWSTAPTVVAQPAFLTADLGSEQTVSMVRLLPRAGFDQLFPRNFTIDVSGDGANWTQAASQENYVPATGRWYEKTLPLAPGRYVRLTIPATCLYAANGRYYAQIAEFEVYGAPPQVVSFMWTAPGTGNGGATGSASAYDLRFAAAEIATEDDWAAATPLDGEPIPQLAGAAETMTINAGLLPVETRVYFALRAANSIGSLSEAWNSPFVDTPEMAPATISDLTVSGAAATSLTLTFTAVGDNGTDGQATSYDVRYSPDVITSANWASATPASGIDAPSPAGTPESITVTGLQQDTAYYVAVKVIDDLGNQSNLSNVAVGSTLDETAPAAISGLQASLSVQHSITAASASSTLYDTTLPAYAADGSTSTFWSTAAGQTPTTASLTLDLGSVKPVAKVRLLPRNKFPQLFPSSFAIQVSTDGTSWIEAASESSYTAQNGVWYEKTFDARYARYVRLAVAATRLYSNGLYYAQVAEFEVRNPYLVGLSWTAPGDNALAGTAASYAVRYATAAITDAGSWDAATALAGAPSPAVAGTSQSMYIDIDDLPAGTRVYFAIRTSDEAPNESAISNLPYVDVPADTRAPGAITDLAAALIDISSPPKHAASGASASSVLYARYPAANAIDGNASTFWSSQPTSSATAESITIDLGSTQSVGKVRLLPRPGYAALFPSNFAIQLSSDGSGWAAASAEAAYAAQSGVWCEKKFTAQSARYVRLSIQSTKLFPSNGLYYAQISEFEAYPPADQAVQLTWTAPGDSGYTGTATAYEIRWSTTPITDEASWSAATTVADPPATEEAGTSQSKIVGIGELPAGMNVWFSVGARDEEGRWGGVGGQIAAEY